MDPGSLCTIHIGLDDFDLGFYGCTTHALTYLIHKLGNNIPLQILDYPNLVRLNPSIPWKTRGNGAVALRIKAPCSYLDKLIDLVDKALVEYHEKLVNSIGVRPRDPGKNPGVVISLDPLPPVFGKIYVNALTDVVPPAVILEKLDKFSDGVYISRVFRGRGVVGATAAIGWITQNTDYTYELITYRSRYRYLEKRCIDIESVNKFNLITCDSTFNNIDVETNRILITPHGYDPVLYGVRGDVVDDLKKALAIIRTCEPVVAWTLFRTNQGTDAHIVDRCVHDLRPYRTARLRLRILGKPVVIQGGHVVVRGGDVTGVIDLVFFKPSRLTAVAQKLTAGDRVVVHGHVKPWRDKPCFHVEKLIVVKLAKQYICKAPRCPMCGRRATKKGFGKGYKCQFCKQLLPVARPECTIIERDVRLGLHVPPPSEQKHLIKPIERYGRERYVHPPYQPMPLSEVSNIIEPLLFL